MKAQYLLNCIFTVLLVACTSQPVNKSSQSIETEPYPVAAMPAPAAANKDAAMYQGVSTNRVSSSQQLGTKWGDDVSSHVQQVDLKRLSNQPIDETEVRYAGKQFSGRSINSISLATGKISFSVVDDRGRNLALYREGQNYFLSGNDGQSYQLRYTNSSAQTFEIVASVDGLDVLDGREASRQKSGYVLRPYSSISIEGFRKSNTSVASFTFSTPQQSYAANSSYGSIKNTGIIGTVIYELNVPIVTPRHKNDSYAPAPNAFPAD